MISNNDNFRVSGVSTEVGFALRTVGTGSGLGPGSGMGSGPGSGPGSGLGSGCPSGKLIKYPSRTLDLKAVAKFIERLLARAFSVPCFSQYRIAVLPITNDCILRTSFSRNRRQRKNDAEIDSSVRIPRSVHNEAVKLLI